MFNIQKDLDSLILNNYQILLKNEQTGKKESTKNKKKLSPKSNNNFQKITGSGSISTSGIQPIVVFKKKSSKKGSIEANQTNSKVIQKLKNDKNDKNEYISDGGLNQKLQKFNSNNNISNNNNILNNVYFNNYINDKNHYLPNNKNIRNISDNQKPNNNNTYNKSNNAKKNNEQKHLLSKTLRDFNKRPAIAKNEKSKEIYSSTKSNAISKKLKNKSVNLNNNTNTSGNNIIKKTKQDKKLSNENSKDQEEQKINLMKKLVENGVVNEIKKLQNKTKATHKEKFDERKREMLLKNGLDLNDDIDDEEEEKNETKKNLNDNNLENPKNLESNNTNNIQRINRKFMSKTTRGFYPKINNNLFSFEDNNYIEEKPAKKLKPSINQFEYINRINNEKKKLSPQHMNNNRSNNIFQKRKIKSTNMELNDSFRQKHSRDEKNAHKDMKFKNKSYNNEIVRRSIEEFQDELPFAHKKNHRSSQELKKFVKEKKLKNKKKEDDLLLEKNKKLFLLFKNLYNLNMKDFTKSSPSVTSEHFYTKTPNLPTASSKGKAMMPGSKNHFNYLNSIRNETNNSGHNIRKKKELNEYYIGNDSTLKNNNSTLIDANEYYLNVLESQQLFVNSGLNKIENDIDTENDNDLNISKEQIQKIISKESKKNSSGKKNNNLILKTNDYDDLRKKIDITLKRAGNIFNNKIEDKEKTEEKEEKTDKKEIIVNADGKEKQKNKEKENEIIKKNHIKSPEINIESSNKEHEIITSNKNNIDKNNIDSSVKNTKDNNLPSLSHTYSTNSNPNKKVEIEIEPRAVLNLVEILKFIIQRKVFIILYESYINRAIYQHYNIAFIYFIAVCKQYPFRKIEEFCNYKTYRIAFRHLFKPFIRKAFKIFIKNCYTKRKIEYLIIILKNFFKNKIFSKISNYATYINKKREENKQKIKPLINSLIKPYLKSYYNEFKNKINLHKKKIILNYNNDIDKNIDDNKIKKINFEELKKNIEKADDSINLSDYLNNKEDSINLSDSGNNHRRKNDGSIKMNSFMYESSESKSLSLEPNSEGNDKLHQLKLMLLIKNNLVNGEHEMDIDSNSLNNSLPRITNKKSIGQQMNEKITISDEEDDDDLKKLNINNKLKLKDNDKDLKNKELSNNNSIEVDISAEYDKNNNDIEWGYNINTVNSKDEAKNKKIVKNEKSLDDEDLNNDYYNDFEKVIHSNEEEKEKKEGEEKTKKDDKKDDTKNLNILKNEVKPDKSRNLKQEEKQDNIIKNLEEPTENKNKEINLIDNNNKTEMKKEKEIIKEKENKKEEAKKLDEKNEKEEEEKEKDKNKEKEKDKLKEEEKEKEKNKKKEEDKEKEKEKEREKQREIFSKKVKEIKDPEKLANDLTEDIINKLLTTEIKMSKKKLIPTKKFKFDKFDKMFSQSNSLNNSFGSAGNSHDLYSKEFGLGSLSQLSLADELSSLNDSIMSNYSAHSFFNKTVKDKKKEKSLNLYYKAIAPKLIKMIHKEIIDKYKLIYENISTPMKNNSEKLMMSLALQDAELLRDNYKTTKDLLSITQIMEKDKILKNFEPINKKLRNIDNITSDNFYDKMLNDCIVETAIEIINKERLYGKNGEPLKWSSRTHELVFKYKPNEPKKLADFVCKKLYFAIRNKVGLISDNYDNMSLEQLNYERDRRLTNIIKRDLDEYEYQWNNLEMEETQLKVDNSELIMDQLYNEVIEILEHIQFSRIKPELYQNKSIYACEEIPKLDFQLTTNEDLNTDGKDNNDIINL